MKWAFIRTFVVSHGSEHNIRMLQLHVNVSSFHSSHSRVTSLGRTWSYLFIFYCCLFSSVLIRAACSASNWKINNIQKKATDAEWWDIYNRCSELNTSKAYQKKKKLNWDESMRMYLKHAHTHSYVHWHRECEPCPAERQLNQFGFNRMPYRQQSSCELSLVCSLCSSEFVFRI